MTNPSQSASSAANCKIVGTSPATIELVRLCQRFALSGAPVLLFGPAGSEFEKVAAYIHHTSDRAAQPFVRQRCAHWQDSIDPLRTAGSGTFFVEGIQHASLPVQLRLIAEMDEARLAVRQIDGAVPMPPRIIASSSEHLYSLVENGMLLEDLHWQLCALSLRIPSLSERAEDVPAIAQQMLDQSDLLRGASSPLHLSDSSCRVLKSYAWPGNFRQLQSVLQRAVTLSAADSELEICQADIDHCAIHWRSQRWQDGLTESTAAGSSPGVTNSTAGSDPIAANEPNNVSSSTNETASPTALGKADMQQLVQAVVDKGIVEADRAHRESHSFVVDRVEKALIAAVLAQCGNVQKAAALKLGMNRNTLHKKIKDYGLE